MTSPAQSDPDALTHATEALAQANAAISTAAAQAAAEHAPTQDDAAPAALGTGE